MPRRPRKKMGRPRKKSGRKPASSLLTIHDVALHLNIPDRHVRELIRDGELKAVHIGQLTKRVSPRALKQFEDAHDGPIHRKEK